VLCPLGRILQVAMREVLGHLYLPVFVFGLTRPPAILLGCAIIAPPKRQHRAGHMIPTSLFMRSWTRLRSQTEVWLLLAIDGMEKTNVCFKSYVEYDVMIIWNNWLLLGSYDGALIVKAVSFYQKLKGMKPK
jgi:hypothetical protein